MGELVMLNEEKGVFGMADLMKAEAEVLGGGGIGSAYKAAMENGLAVVVKRVRDMNRVGKEAFDGEMRRLGRLRHPNILTPVAYHYKRDEKLVISEYVPQGSLFFVLHGDRGICHAKLTRLRRLNIIHGIEFIHSEFSSYALPHGNLKSSNVLLSENFQPLLNDFAFHPLTNPSQSSHPMFAFKSPEFLKSQKISPKCDVFCLGIVILEILTGKLPSQYLNADKGGIDVVEWVVTSISQGKEFELIDPKIRNSFDGIHLMIKMIHIGIACIENSLAQRLDMKEAVRRILEVQI